jgi:hypothetical protein
VSAVVAFLVAALSQEALPEKMLEALKAASVYVSSNSSVPGASGSGFLIRREGDTGYVVTNEHVVEGIASREVLLTFFSGTASERRIVGTAISIDEDRDLAVIKIQMKELPDPLPLNARPKLLETASVTVLGFPFGAALQTSERHPAITVSRGSIASLRKSRGILERVQIDGNINPGNSGGPVVDKTGALIGVTVSKITGTNIAFAIPSWQVEEMLEGRLLALHLVVAEVQGANARLRVSAMLNNPLSKIKAVSLLWISRKTSAANPKEGADGTWTQAAPDMKEENLALSGESAKAEFTATEVRQDPLYLIQAKLVRSDGKIMYSAPREVRVDGPALPDAPAVPAPRPDPALGPENTPNPRPAANPAAGMKASPADALGSVSEMAPPLRTPPEKGTGFTRTQLQVSPAAGGQSILWSTDASQLFLLESGGILRKIDVATLKQVRQFTAGFPASLLARCSEGILFYVPAFEEVWVLDENSLLLKKKIQTGLIRTLTGHAGSPLTFAAGSGNVYSLNTSLGRIDKTWTCSRMSDGTLGRPKIARYDTYLNDPSQAILSGDGKYLLLTDNGCLNRFRVEGSTLVYEERGPQIGASEVVRLEVSAEAKYVALASNQSNRSAPGHPEDKQGIWVYRIGDFSEPISVVPQATTVVAFDRVAGCAYGNQRDGHSLLVFTPRDASQRVVPIMKSADEPAVQILVHPQGRKFFWVSKMGSVYWVELDP